jgi:predicted secreted Zn-dependent protease
MRKLLLLCLLLIVKTSSAEVSAGFDYIYYPANANSSSSLLSTLNSASPIRVNNHTFHGYTKWYVKWNYRWLEQADGRCKITKVTTNLTATITLPELIGASSAQTEIFDKYLSALRVHELGHYSIGKEAADTIDSGILALPEMSSCKNLESSANNLGYQILDEYREKEKQYDVSTAHGKSQGAWLEN